MKNNTAFVENEITTISCDRNKSWNQLQMLIDKNTGMRKFTLPSSFTLSAELAISFYSDEVYSFCEDHTKLGPFIYASLRRGVGGKCSILKLKTVESKLILCSYRGVYQMKNRNYCQFHRISTRLDQLYRFTKTQKLGSKGGTWLPTI